MPESSGAEGARVVNEPLRRIGRDNSFGRGTWMSLVEVFDHRELLGRLVRREVRAKYKDSSLGFVWSAHAAAGLLVIYYVAIGQFLGAARAIPDFAIFVFTGLTAWGSTARSSRPARTRSSRTPDSSRRSTFRARSSRSPRSGSALFNFAVQFVPAPRHDRARAASVGRRARLPAASLILILVFGTALGLVCRRSTCTCATCSISSRSLCWSCSGRRRSSTRVRFVADGSAATWLEDLYLRTP